MASVYLLIPLSIVLIGVGVWAFFWAVDRGQFEDLGAAERLALEEDAAVPTEPSAIPTAGVAGPMQREESAANAAASAARFRHS